MTTFTVKTVHGLEETFVVGPGGKVDTTASYRNKPTVDQWHAEATSPHANPHPNDQSGSSR